MAVVDEDEDGPAVGQVGGLAVIRLAYTAGFNVALKKPSAPHLTT